VLLRPGLRFQRFKGSADGGSNRETAPLRRDPFREAADAITKPRS
jgi:hypothetical protein